MNIKQLEVFLAVAESGSFSKGAEATFITQSTVSKHISSLEQEFDLPLFDRTGKGALLTAAGKLLAAHAGRIIAGMNEAGLALHRFKGAEEALLRIGGSNIPADYLIPAALPRLLAKFPGVSVTVCQGDSRGILDRLLKEEMELCIVGSLFAAKGIDFTPLGSDLIRLVVGKRHPWRERSCISIAELEHEPLLVRESGSGSGQALLDALAQAGLNRADLRIIAVLGSNEAVKQAVMGGLGIAFVSELSVQKELERGELTALPVDGLEIVRDFYLAVRSGRMLSPAALAFVNVMEELCAQA